MIDFYFWPTPNGWKISIALEEMGLPYNVIPLRIGQGEQFTEAFERISPSHRMPAIVDHEPLGGGDSFPLAESGAILMYLAEKSGQFLPTDVQGRYEVMQWLLWQTTQLGPMMGQHGHFALYAKQKIPYAIDRYRYNVLRLFKELDKRLKGREHIDALKTRPGLRRGYDLLKDSRSSRGNEAPDEEARAHLFGETQKASGQVESAS